MPDFLLRKEWLLVFGAVVLAVGATLAGLAYTYVAGPTRLAVAVGPATSVETRLIDAYAKALAQHHTDLRLHVVSFASLKDSAEALQRGAVDLAVARPDILLPDDGLTVAILREEALIVVAPEAADAAKDGKIAAVKDLAGKRLGVVDRHEADLDLARTLLAYYDLAPPAVTVVPLAPDGIAAAVADRRVDAVAFLAAPSGNAAAALLHTVAQAGAGGLAFVAAPESAALARKKPALTAIDIPAGALGGRPTEPGEEVKAIGVSYRLMARAGLDRGTVAEVARHLFEMRSRLAKATPSANLMKAPDTDDATTATLPYHPGAIDYFEREQQTFMDRYGDWIYLLLWVGGGGGSALAWFAQRLMRERREQVDDVLDRLLAILDEVRAVTSIEALNALAAEMDKLVVVAVQSARNRTTDTRTMSGLILAIDSARSAIADRRRDLLDHGVAPHAPRSGSAPRITAAS